MSSSRIRTSQRVSRSCTECTRRKIKCDKTIPCKPCIQRNVAHECVRPIVRVGGKLTLAGDAPASVSVTGPEGSSESLAELLKERSALRAQVAQLEFALSSSKPGTRRAPLPLSTDIRGETSETEPALEKYDLGARLLDHEVSIPVDTSAIQRLWEPSIEPVLAVLPTKTASHQLVSWSLANLGWIPCAVRADQFLQQHDSFWESMERHRTIAHDQHSWLAAYFGVLAVAVIYMDYHELPPIQQMPRPPQNLQTQGPPNLALARLWYEAAVMELKRSNAFGRALLETVQAAMILTLCHSIFGEFEREQLLNGLALQAARIIEMHHLGTEDSHPVRLHARPEWSTSEGRDLGRRLWWSLVTCDWLGPWTRAPTISPATFHVQLPGRSPTDYELLPVYESNREGRMPSPALYLSTISRIAYIFYVYIGANSHRSPEKLSRALEEIGFLQKAIPLHLSDRFPADENDKLWESQHQWITFQRYLISHVIDFCQLTIARTLLLTSEGDIDGNYHSIAVASAMRILEHAQRAVPRMFRIVWIVPAATVAASLFLSLDLLVSDTTKPQNPKTARIPSLLVGALQTLRRYSEGTMRTEKGCDIIERLSSMIGYWHPPANTKYGEAARSALAQAADDMTPNMQQLAGFDDFDFDFDTSNLEFTNNVASWEFSEFDGGLFAQQNSNFIPRPDQNIGQWP